MRTLLLCALLCSSATMAMAADSITPESLHGAWELDVKSATKDQADAVKTAQSVDGFGMTFTLRTARAIFSDDNFAAGMWRVEDATATTATVVIQPKGGEERTLHITLDGKKMTCTEVPGNLPLVKTR